MRLRYALLIAAVLLLGTTRAPTVFDLDRIGHAAPPLTLTLADGTSLPLASLRGKPAYVFLFASWCEPCAIEIPWIRGAYAAYGDRVNFVGIDVLDSPANATAYVRRAHLPFDVAIVGEAAIDAVAGPSARLAAGDKYELPAGYLIDAAGVVTAAWHGVPVNADGTPIDILPSALAKAGFAR